MTLAVPTPTPHLNTVPASCQLWCPMPDAFPLSAEGSVRERSGRTTLQGLAERARLIAAAECAPVNSLTGVRPPLRGPLAISPAVPDHRAARIVSCAWPQEHPSSPPHTASSKQAVSAAAASDDGPGVRSPLAGAPAREVVAREEALTDAAHCCRGCRWVAAGLSVRVWPVCESVAVAGQV